MPFTPFMGLSAMFHIGIIAIYKLFSKLIKKLPKITPNTLGVKVFSYFIILGVFGTVLSSAGILLRASILDEHSSFRFAENYVAANHPLAYFSQNTVNATMKTPVPASFAPIADIATATRTFNSVEITAAAAGNSVVDYLQSRNTDFSFEARKSIASELGIADYQGTQRQNTLLLRKLSGVWSDASVSGSMSCQEKGQGSPLSMGDDASAATH